MGECGGLRESLAGALLLRGYLHRELDGRYAALTTALAGSPCRLRRARLAWAGEGTEGQLPVAGSALCMSAPDQPPADCAVPNFIVHLPFVRSYIGNTLASIATPDWFRHYRLEPTK